MDLEALLIGLEQVEAAGRIEDRTSGSAEPGELGVGRRSDGCAVVCGRELLIVVLDIHIESQTDLAGIGETGGGASRLACLGKDREENGGENRDNGDDHEQLDKRKTGRYTRMSQECCLS